MRIRVDASRCATKPELFRLVSVPKFRVFLSGFPCPKKFPFLPYPACFQVKRGGKGWMRKGKRKEVKAKKDFVTLAKSLS